MHFVSVDVLKRISVVFNISLCPRVVKLQKGQKPYNFSAIFHICWSTSLSLWLLNHLHEIYCSQCQVFIFFSGWTTFLQNCCHQQRSYSSCLIKCWTLWLYAHCILSGGLDSRTHSHCVFFISQHLFRSVMPTPRRELVSSVVYTTCCSRPVLL